MVLMTRGSVRENDAIATVIKENLLRIMIAMVKREMERTMRKLSFTKTPVTWLVM